MHLSNILKDKPEKQITNKRLQTGSHERIRWEQNYLLRTQQLEEGNKAKNDFVKEQMRKEALKKTVNAGSSSANNNDDDQIRNKETGKLGNKESGDKEATETEESEEETGKLCSLIYYFNILTLMSNKLNKF